VKSSFLCNLGRGDPSKAFERLPRFDFEEVCGIV
jgi:3-hydroxypropanoate dehydrogenase